MGKNGTAGDSYWVSCINEPFTIKSSYGGCGYDDIYTRCSGRTALGIDGDQVLCDAECVTHRIYKDLDVTTWTPFLGCGRGTSTMNLLRASTHSGDEDEPPTTEDLAPETTSAGGFGEDSSLASSHSSYPPASSSTFPSPSSNTGLSAGAVAGIAVGSAVGVLLVAGAAGFLIFRRYRKQRQLPDKQTSSDLMGGQKTSAVTQNGDIANQLDSRGIYEMP